MTADDSGDVLAQLAAMTTDRNRWIRKARTEESARRRDRNAREPFMRELARYMVDELRTAKFIEITERAITEPNET